MDTDIDEDTDEAGEKDEECPFFAFDLFFDDSVEVENDKKNRINENENICSDRGELSESGVLVGKSDSFLEDGVSSLGFGEREFHRRGKLKVKRGKKGWRD
ncbi:MAG: hypothetical protein LBU27_02125 [Candidatus Peribacteria bacterium]|nr:hypothetical protein [Candidatus Peribacteria bacterium]